jgi:hypothetical protein
MERDIYRSQANQAARRGATTPRRPIVAGPCEWFLASTGRTATPDGEVKICEACESSLRGLIPPIPGVILHGEVFTWNG